jgi:DNA-binding MarR family transcriptional regulator
MPFLLIKDLPRYDCLQEAAQRFPDLDPSACEAFLQLLRTGDELSRSQQTYLAQHNMSQGRFTVLMLLLRAAGPRGCCGAQPATVCNPAELADRAGVTRATMTGLIDTLEKDGFVKREPDPSDRRMMTVSLTPKAEAFLHDVLPGQFRRIAEVMQDLDESERRALVHLLSKVVSRASDLNSPPASASAGQG